MSGVFVLNKKRHIAMSFPYQFHRVWQILIFGVPNSFYRRTFNFKNNETSNFFKGNIWEKWYYHALCFLVCTVSRLTSLVVIWTGYMIHEAVVWSNVHKKWFFLPRKASKSKYNDVDDERHGTNLLLVAGDQVRDVGNNLWS